MYCTIIHAIIISICIALYYICLLYLGESYILYVLYIDCYAIYNMHSSYKCASFFLYLYLELYYTIHIIIPTIHSYV